MEARIGLLEGDQGSSRNVGTPFAENVDLRPGVDKMKEKLAEQDRLNEFQLKVNEEMPFGSPEMACISGDSSNLLIIEINTRCFLFLGRSKGQSILCCCKSSSMNIRYKIKENLNKKKKNRKIKPKKIQVKRN